MKIEDRSEFLAFLDLLAWSAQAEPHTLLNAVDVTRGDDALFWGVCGEREDQSDSCA